MDELKPIEQVSIKKKPRTSGGEKAVKLVKPDQRVLRVRIRGLSPLIVHAWDQKAIRQMEDSQTGAKKVKAKTTRDPEEEYQAAFYRDENRQYCFPARAIKKAVVSAASSLGDTFFSKVKLRQAIFIQGDLLPIIYRTPPRMRTDTVRLNAGKTTLRYRPEFADWAIEVTIEYNASVYSAEQVINLLCLAGYGVGLGEWRPEKDGDNGRFEVVNG